MSQISIISLAKRQSPPGNSFASLRLCERLNGSSRLVSLGLDLAGLYRTEGRRSCGS